MKLSEDDMLMLNCIQGRKHAMQPGFIPDSGNLRTLKGLDQLDLVCIFCGTTDRQYFGALDPEVPISHNYEWPKRYEELKAVISPREAKAILARQQRKDRREMRQLITARR